MVRICDICGREYEARRADSRTCSAACRKRRGRGARPQPQQHDSPLYLATHRELEAAGALNTWRGQQALVLAARMSGSETNAGVAALSRELRSVIQAALGTKAAGGNSDDDFIDELQARRDAKRSIPD